MNNFERYFSWCIIWFLAWCFFLLFMLNLEWMLDKQTYVQERNNQQLIQNYQRQKDINDMCIYKMKTYEALECVSTDQFGLPINS